jgi:hypothetical protein
MTENPDSTDPAKLAILGASHISLSNLISYTLVTGAGMLAFFFAFQASLLANYHSIHSALLDKSISVGKSSLPIGKIALSCISVLVVIFNVWSYKMIRVIGYYFESLMTSGERLERSVGLPEGIYISLFETRRKLGRSDLLYLISPFLVILSFVWLALAILAWTA